MRPTKKPTLRQQLDALLEDISDRGREVMIMADLWREERIKSKKLVEALETIQRGMGDAGSSQEDWEGLDHHVLRENMANIFTEARAALAGYKKETE